MPVHLLAGWSPCQQATHAQLLKPFEQLCMTGYSRCLAMMLQLDELMNAVERAAENPSKFNLTNEELSTRRRWVDSTRQQVLWVSCKGALVLVA